MVRILESTNVYFIGNVDLRSVKIGKSNNPKKRLAELQTGNSHNLMLYAVVENVTPDYEMELHKLLKHLQMKGEWFELTDELIHFMINKTDETSCKYKINSKLNSHIGIDKVVNKNSGLDENFIKWCMRQYLIEHDDTLRKELELREIHVSYSGGEWFYLNQGDENSRQFKHYLCQANILNYKELQKWNEEWILKTIEDSKEWENIKFSIGYSNLIPLKGSYTIQTISINIPETDVLIVVYEGGVYAANYLDFK